MILNKIEFILMNNFIRNIIQEYIEIKRLRKLSNLTSNKIILEIGCGTGNGSKLIKKYFKTNRKSKRCHNNSLLSYRTKKCVLSKNYEKVRFYKCCRFIKWDCGLFR